MAPGICGLLSAFGASSQRAPLPQLAPAPLQGCIAPSGRHLCKNKLWHLAAMRFRLAGEELPVVMGCLQPGPPIQSRSTFAATLDGFVHTRDTQPAGCNGHTALLWCELTDLTRIPYKASAGIASSTIAVAAAQWCKPGCGLLRRTTTHPDGLSSKQGRCGRLRNSQGDSMQAGWSN